VFVDVDLHEGVARRAFDRLHHVLAGGARRGVEGDDVHDHLPVVSIGRHVDVVEAVFLGLPGGGPEHLPLILVVHHFRDRLEVLLRRVVGKIASGGQDEALRPALVEDLDGLAPRIVLVAEEQHRGQLDVSAEGLAVLGAEPAQIRDRDLLVHRDVVGAGAAHRLQVAGHVSAYEEGREPATVTDPVEDLVHARRHEGLEVLE
jgi:hypothetical protein